MKLRYFGHACFSLTFESGAVIVADPFDPSVTFAPCTQKCDYALVSHGHFDHNYTQSLTGSFKTIDAPGVYEADNIRITGKDSFHDDQCGALRGKNTVFIIESEGLRIAHLGDLGHMPGEELLSHLTGLDLLLIPVGGTYTIDTPQAIHLIRETKPRCAVAMHYLTEAYPTINVTTPEQFCKEMCAAHMPREITVTKENIAALPAAIIMDYE